MLGQPKNRRSIVVCALTTAFVAGTICTTAIASGPCGTSTPWSTFAGDNARTGDNPCESHLSTTNVPNLNLLWSAPLKSSYSIAQPTYVPGLMINGASHDVLFVADEHGLVQALDAASGAVFWKRSVGSHHSSCPDIPDGRWGVSAAPVLDLSSETGYLATGNDEVRAIDLTTGRNRKAWQSVKVGTSKLDHVYGAITMANGRLYVATGSYCDMGTYFGHVDAIDIATHQIVDTWTVVPRSTGEYGGGIWGPGGVAVDDATGDVYAATGNSLPGANAGYAEQVVRLDRNLNVTATHYVPLVGIDVDYGATPLLFEPPGCPALVAAKNKSGLFVLYERDLIGSGPIQTLQIASNQDFRFNGIPAYSPETNMVYVSNSSDSNSDVYTHGMVALSVGADCTLALAWQQAVGPPVSSVSPPTVANGVVYYGDGFGGTLRAFDAQTGMALWDSGSTINGPIFAAPLVVDGRVFVSTWDGHVYAFSAP